MDIDSLLTVVLVVAGIGYILVRRMMGRLVTIKNLFLLPAVLTVVGIDQCAQFGRPAPTTVLLLAAGVLVSLLIGVVRGTTVRLEHRDAGIWMRYRPVTVALWVVNIAAKVAMVPLEQALTPGANVASQAVLVSVGVGLLAESAVVLLRATRRGTVSGQQQPLPTHGAGAIAGR